MVHRADNSELRYIRLQRRIWPCFGICPCLPERRLSQANIIHELDNYRKLLPTSAYDMLPSDKSAEVCLDGLSDREDAFFDVLVPLIVIGLLKRLPNLMSNRKRN